MKYYLNISLGGLVSLSLLLSCGKYSYIKDRNHEYLQAKTEPSLQLPPHLASNTYSHADLMPIPANIAQLNAQQAQELQRPKAVNQQEELQEFSLEHGANGPWLLILREPAQIWVPTYNFWQSLGFKLLDETTQVGEIISDWQSLETVNLHLARQNLARLSNEIKSNTNLKITAQIKQGLQPNSSEVTLQVFTQHDALKRNFNLETELLTRLQTFLTNTPSVAVSMLASQYFTGYSLPTLEHDVQGSPFLSFNADFERTWAYLNTAINATAIKIEDIDRSKGIFYVDVAAQLPKPNFFMRLFARKKAARYQLQVKTVENKQFVTVQAASNDVALPVLESLYQQLSN